MAQGQEMQAVTATTWGSHEVRALSSRAAPPAKFDRDKEMSTDFFVRSIFAGGMAGCAVTPSCLIHSELIGQNFDRAS
jgi:hypothetical protein